jgi:hypothetical protein
MTADEAVRLTRQHVERHFPKQCAKCGFKFKSLADYLRQTTHVGDPISYDEEAGHLRPLKPMGTSSFANCRCGTTLVITSEGMNLLTLWRLMYWARTEAKRRGMTWRQVVAWVRGEVDRQVLAENPKDPPERPQ